MYEITKREIQDVIQNHFQSENPLVLRRFPAREKKKFIAVFLIRNLFEEGKVYSENEVNRILQTVYSDHVTIRRYLVDYGFLMRKTDGSEYWKGPEPKGFVGEKT